MIYSFNTPKNQVFWAKNSQNQPKIYFSIDRKQHKVKINGKGNFKKKWIRGFGEVDFLGGERCKERYFKLNYKSKFLIYKSMEFLSLNNLEANATVSLSTKNIIDV